MVPVARRLGLGSVLGYLIAGVVIGPYGLRLLGGGASVMHVAEFGVVMMLFVIGLELEPSMLWRLRGPILGMGGLQVVGSSLVLGAGTALLGLRWQAAVAVGMTLALSSTAIVLQSLAERGVLKTAGGNQSRAAKMLGITRGSLRSKTQALGLKIDQVVSQDEGSEPPEE